MSSKYENQLLVEEINSEPTENKIEEFCLVYKLKGTLMQI